MNRDPGLQPERTALAWRRTAVSMLVNGALLLRAAAEARSPALRAAALCVVIASAVLFAVGEARRRALASGYCRAPHAAVAALLVAAVGLACAAALLSHIP